MIDHTFKLQDGRTLGYSDYGKAEGRTLFFFHGTPGSRIMGLEDDPLLEQLHLRIIAPERPGYGLSDPCPNRKVMDWPADVASLADHLGIDRFHVGGESGGGLYTVATAIALNQRVISATLVASATPPDLPSFRKGMDIANRIGFFMGKYMPFLSKILCRYTASVVQKSPQAFVAALTKHLCEWDRQVIESSDPDLLASMLQHFVEAYRQGGDGHYGDTILVSRPWGLAYEKITAPVFLWHGEADTLVPITPSKEFMKMLPNCESHFIPQAGHMLLESHAMRAEILNRILSVN